MESHGPWRGVQGHYTPGNWLWDIIEDALGEKPFFFQVFHARQLRDRPHEITVHYTGDDRLVHSIPVAFTNEEWETLQLEERFRVALDTLLEKL